MAIPIKNIADNAVNTIFNLFESIQESVVISNAEGTAAYNPETGEVTKDGNSSSVKVIFTNREYTRGVDVNDIDESKLGDYLMVVKKEDLGGFSFDLEARVVRPDRSVWFVTKIDEDPTSTFIEAMVRKGY